MSIVDQTEELLQDRQTAARRTYKELALRAEHPRAGDAKLLAETLTTLQMTPDDFREHVRKLAADEADRAEVLSPSALAKLEQSAAAQVAQVDSETIDELMRIVRAMDPDYLLRFVFANPGTSVELQQQLQRRRYDATLGVVNAKSHNNELLQRIAKRRAENAIVFGE